MRSLKSLLPFLVASALAAPAQDTTESADLTPKSPFSLVVASSNPQLNNQPVSATNYQLWIGRPSSTFCPASRSADTAIPDVDDLGQSDASSPCADVSSSAQFVAKDGSLGLNVGVPGGQTLYVTPQGILKYTRPNVKIAEDEQSSTRSGFIISGPEANGLGRLTFTSGRGNIAGKGGFVACPSLTNQSGWEIGVRLNQDDELLQTGGCVDVDLMVPLGDVQVAANNAAKQAWAYD